MKTKRVRRETRHGFTLIELMVVLAILMILATLTAPMIQGAMSRSRLTAALNQGKALYDALFAAALDGLAVLPRSTGPGAPASSTEYWCWVITNKVVDADFSIFSAHGLPQYRGLDPQRFTTNQNAWCITADIGETTRNVTPVLFSRNLEIRRLNDPPGPALSDTAPFGKRGVVVVRKGGQGQVLKAEELAEGFNPGLDNNPVLRP